MKGTINSFEGFEDFLLFSLFCCILIFYCFYIIFRNEPEQKGCEHHRRHKWVLINKNKEKLNKYFGTITNWKEFKCKKCGKIEKRYTYNND